jgi:hypothetical protein
MLLFKRQNTTAEQLYGTLKFIDSLDAKLGLQKTLESIGEALTNLVGSPANPTYQSTLASALASFETAASKLAESITPSQFAAVKEMGGDAFFDPLIAEKVKSSVQLNAMTPSVAKDFVQDLASKRSTFLTTVRGARQNLEKLGIRESGIKADSADIAFLIPRTIFDNRLGPLAKELTFISRLMQDFSEALTGQAVQVELEQLSSSVPTVSLLAGVVVIEVLARVVNKFLEAWERIEKIRKMRAELTEMGLKGTAVEELTETITTTVDGTVEESVELVLANYKGDEGRKQELGNAIRQDTRRLFGQIERGLTIELRAGAASDKEGDGKEALQNIADMSKSMQFPNIPQEPILLGNGEILEGDIQAVKSSKKTTTHKSTTTRKDTHKENKTETK